MQDNTNSLNLVSEFTQDMLTEIGLGKETEGYDRMRKTIEDRVIARVFLELISCLTPEQAALVATDAKRNECDPEAIFASLVRRIPNLQGKVAQVMASSRLEILSDLKGLAAASA